MKGVTEDGVDVRLVLAFLVSLAILVCVGGAIGADETWTRWFLVSCGGALMIAVVWSLRQWWRS